MLTRQRLLDAAWKVASVEVGHVLHRRRHGDKPATVTIREAGVPARDGPDAGKEGARDRPFASEGIAVFALEIFMSNDQEQAIRPVRAGSGGGKIETAVGAQDEDGLVCLAAFRAQARLVGGLGPRG